MPLQRSARRGRRRRGGPRRMPSGRPASAVDAGRHAADDGRVAGERVCRVQLVDLLRGEGGGQRRPVDLLVEVRPQVPRHGLQPGHRVGRRPRLGFVAGVLQAEHGVLEREVAPSCVAEVGIHAVGVGLVVGERDRVEQFHLGLGDRPPAERADERVGADLALAEQLGQAPGGHMPAEVHLPEAVLGVHVPLRHEQVVRGLRDDLRDAGLVAVHGRVGAEPRQAHLAGQRRERAHHGPDAEPAGDERGAEKHAECGQHDAGGSVSSAARCVGAHITPL